MQTGFDNSYITEFIAYDPGGHTGYAKCKVDLATKSIYIYETGEFPNWAEIEKQLARKNKKNFVVVYESFQLRIIEAVLVPVEVIGVIKFLTNKKKILRFAQTPAQRKCIDKTFPKLQQYISSHPSDAVRHAMYFVLFKLNINGAKFYLKVKKEFVRIPHVFD